MVQCTRCLVLWCWYVCGVCVVRVRVRGARCDTRRSHMLEQSPMAVRARWATMIPAQFGCERQRNRVCPNRVCPDRVCPNEFAPTGLPNVGIGLGWVRTAVLLQSKCLLCCCNPNAFSVVGGFGCLLRKLLIKLAGIHTHPEMSQVGVGV
jgi:hypothetical protein